MRAALNSLSVAAPDWLKRNILKDWYDFYGRRIENYRLPKLDSEREKLGNKIGRDGFNLLDKIYSDRSPDWLRHIAAVETLRQVWIQQFYAPELNQDGRRLNPHFSQINLKAQLRDEQ